MQFYVIPPLSRLDLMEQGDRIFVLAQLWKQSEEYRQQIKAYKAEGKWITLDNGAGDFNTTTTQEELIAIVEDLMPNEVIPLDVLYERESTLYNLRVFITMLEQKDLLDKVEIFAVPQGKDKREWKMCYEEMLENPYVKTIGFSKITVPSVFETGADDQGIMEGRHLCYDELKSEGLLLKPIHCLGAGDPREFVKYIGDPIMRSTDSCFSVWAAMNGISWEEGNFERIKTPHDYFDRSVSEEAVEVALSNINFLKKVLNVGTNAE